MDSSSNTVFTPLNLQSMCDFEMKFVNRTDYKNMCLLNTYGSNQTCVPQAMSVVNLFYSNPSFSMVENQTCPLLSQSDVDSVVSVLFENALNVSVPEETRLFYSFFLSKDADANTYANSKTKSILVLGSPLSQDSNEKEDLTGYDLDGPYQTFLEAVGEAWVDTFGLKNRFLKTKFRNDAVVEDRLELKWINEAILSKEFEYMVNSDMSMAGASVVFVLCWMWFHTGSFALACLGMYQIVMSIPVALFFYRYFFQIEYFQSLHQMTIFLVCNFCIFSICLFSLSHFQRTHTNSRTTNKKGTWYRSR